MRHFSRQNACSLLSSQGKALKWYFNKSPIFKIVNSNEIELPNIIDVSWYLFIHWNCYLFVCVCLFQALLWSMLEKPCVSLERLKTLWTWRWSRTSLIHCRTSMKKTSRRFRYRPRRGGTKRLKLSVDSQDSDLICASFFIIICFIAAPPEENGGSPPGLWL